MHHVGPRHIALQRSQGTGLLSIAAGTPRPRLRQLHQEGCAKIRLPRVHGANLTEVVLINTAGGLTGGDRMDWRIEVGEDACAVVSTQACEKIYRSTGGAARVASSIIAGDGAAIAWLPQETILFDRSALSRRLEVDLAPTATALMVEPLMLGRQAMGERIAAAEFTDRWRIRQDGALIHAEDIRLRGPVDTMLARPAIAGGKVALATVLLVHPRAAELLEAIRALLQESGGASAWAVRGHAKLLVRMLAENAYSLRERLVPILGLCHEMVTGGSGGDLPKVWQL